MRRLTPLDRLLVLVLVPIWAAAFILYLEQAVPGRLAWVPVFVSAAADARGYPTVSELRSGAPGLDLVVGDRLLRVGDSDLRGLGPIGFTARVHAEAGPALSARVVYERAGEAAETTLRLLPVRHAWGIAPMVAALAGTGLLVLLRLPHTPVGRAFFLGAISYATHWSLFGGGPQTPAWTVVFFVSSLVMLPLCLRPFLLFPDEVAPRDGRLPRWPWAFAVCGPLVLSWVFATPFSHAVGQSGTYVTNVVFALTYLWLLSRNYRRSGPVGRRQLKWVLYGFYVSLVPMVTIDLTATVRPSLWWLHEVAPIALLPIPLCLLIAIVRYNLLDIDRLIASTTVYSGLLIVGLGMVLTVVPRLAAAASAPLGMAPEATQLALSALLAVSLVPTQRSLRPWIERRFLPERHQLEAGFQSLLEGLSECPTVQAMLVLAGEKLGEVLRPRVCRVYAATEDGYALAYSGGALVSGSVTRDPGPGPKINPTAGGGTRAALDPPPREDVGLSLPAVATLASPVHLASSRDRSLRRLPISGAERRTLESLGLDVIVPVRRGDRPAALIGLGSKRSGDVYTATDLALLGALADKLSSGMLRFDDAEIVRQERAMQEALRQYVPDPLVGLLASGRQVEGQEREVSILFVDLRSFTSYSEKHDSGIVFSVVNVYTEAVSAVIREHGGTVVEFLGDGMMAVFGAPETTTDYARAAVQCGREIVSVVRELKLGDPGTKPIEVSVGITTGNAFVGNVRAADRLIYTAIGDMANLASRLEGLTRQLSAAIAIDAATRAGAGDAAAPFVRHGPTLVRGREQAVDVYFLPL